MFPSVVFRRAYDMIQTPHRGTKGDLEYLRILHLAATTLETDVEAALELLLGDGRVVSADAVKGIAGGAHVPDVPMLASTRVDLGDYDTLLVDGALAEVGT